MKKIILAFALLTSSISFAVTNKSLVGKTLTCIMSDDRKIPLRYEVYKFDTFRDKFLAEYTNGRPDDFVAFLPYNINKSDILTVGQYTETYNLKLLLNGIEVHESAAGDSRSTL